MLVTLHPPGSLTPKARSKLELAQRWARHLQACILSKIGNFFEVRSCNLLSCGKSKLLPHPSSRGPKGWGRGCVGRAFSGVTNANHGEKSEVVTSPLPSWGRKRGRKCYVTHAFLGVPNAEHGDKIRMGYLTPAFSGAPKRAGGLCNPWVLGGPQHQARGVNER